MCACTSECREIPQKEEMEKKWAKQQQRQISSEGEQVADDGDGDGDGDGPPSPLINLYMMTMMMIIPDVDDGGVAACWDIVNTHQSCLNCSLNIR